MRIQHAKCLENKAFPRGKRRTEREGNQKKKEKAHLRAEALEAVDARLGVLLRGVLLGVLLRDVLRGVPGRRGVLCRAQAPARLAAVAAVAAGPRRLGAAQSGGAHLPYYMGSFRTFPALSSLRQAMGSH